MTSQTSQRARPLTGLLAAIALAAVAHAQPSPADEDYPWNVDPDPVTREQSLQGDPPPPVRIDALDGMSVRWLGELTAEQLASLARVESTGAESSFDYLPGAARNPETRSLNLQMRQSIEPMIGSMVWVATTFESGTTSAGETFPESGSRATPTMGHAPSGEQLRFTARFDHPRYEAEWITDLKGTVTLDVRHPRQARLVIDDIPSLDGRTIHLAGVEGDRLHVDLDESTLWLYLSERLSHRIIDMHVYNAAGQAVDGHFTGYISRYYRDMPRSHLPRRFPGRKFTRRRGEDQIHRVHLIMHADSARFDVPFALDRVRIPYPGNILREDDADAVVATEQPGEADAPEAPPLEGELEVIIE